MPLQGSTYVGANENVWHIRMPINKNIDDLFEKRKLLRMRLESTKQKTGVSIVDTHSRFSKCIYDV